MCQTIFERLDLKPALAGSGMRCPAGHGRCDGRAVASLEQYCEGCAMFLADALEVQPTLTLRKKASIKIAL